MPGTNQDDDTKSHVAAVVPTSNKTALTDIAWEWDEKEDRTNMSDLVRDAIVLYLATLKAQDAIPDDARDDVEHIDAGDVLSRYGLVAGSTSTDDLEVAP